MRIQVNGEFREVDEQLSLLDLIARLGLRSERLAIELNGKVVRHVDWSGTVLHADDKIEIVHFVGGGCGANCMARRNQNRAVATG